MTLPVLSLPASARADLSAWFEHPFQSLGRYFTLADADEDDADLATARTVAAEIDGIEHSSDVDCGYYPCTLTGPELGSDAFFAAVGVARDARESVGGYDNPKLEVVAAGDGEHERAPILLITWLGAHHLEDIHEYVAEDDVAAFERALAMLARTGTVHGVQLATDDRVSKIQLTVSKQPSGAYAGVLTVSVET